jgi:uncharacterized coiled-coil DUF342 family protein
MEWFFSFYSWKRLTSNQIKKLQKKLKKSYKKADNLKKKNNEIFEKEIQEAEKFLDDMLPKI